MKKYIWWIVIVLLLGCGIFLLTRPDRIKDGVKALEKGDYKEAIAHFEKQEKKGKKLDETFWGQGMAYYELGEYNTCIEMLNKALEAGATPDATLYRFVGNSHMKLEQYEKAIEAYTAGIEAGGEGKEALREIKWNRIVAYEQLSDWENAKKAIEEYVAQYPEDDAAKREAEFLKTR